MGVAGSLGVIGAGTAWRIAGIDGAGRALVRATRNDDQQIKTLGGMMLVRGGDRSVELVRAAVESDELNAILVRALGDIGGDRSKQLLIEIARGEGPMAEEAATALETLERIEQLEDE